MLQTSTAKVSHHRLLKSIKSMYVFRRNKGKKEKLCWTIQNIIEYYRMGMGQSMDFGPNWFFLLPRFISGSLYVCDRFHLLSMQQILFMTGNRFKRRGTFRNQISFHKWADHPTAYAYLM